MVGFPARNASAVDPKAGRFSDSIWFSLVTLMVFFLYGMVPNCPVQAPVDDVEVHLREQQPEWGGLKEHYGMGE
jgi:hypothetical protein